MKKPLPILNKKMEDILRAVHFYRYMTALDVAYLLFDPKSITHVREVLGLLSGGMDQQGNQYLYRFRRSTGEKVYTLGARGRRLLMEEFGIPVEWHFQPEKVRFLSHSHIIHSLLLTRFLVAAHVWSRQHPNFALMQERISYELAKERKDEPVIPDAWLLFEKKEGEVHVAWFPILLEIDRGMEYQVKFKQHIKGRIGFIESGAYQRMFGQEAVVIAYATTGDTPEFRATRRKAMCSWTLEVLREKGKEEWSSVFRFTELTLESIYVSSPFSSSLWCRPDSPAAMPLIAGA